MPRNTSVDWQDDVIDRLARIEEITTGTQSTTGDHETRVRSLERKTNFLFALCPIAVLALLEKLGVHIPLPPLPL